MRLGMNHSAQFYLQTTPYLPSTLIHIHQTVYWGTDCSGRHLTGYYSFINPERMKGWVGRAGWAKSGRFTPISSHLLAVGRAQDRESLPVTDVGCCYCPNIRWVKELKERQSADKIIKSLSRLLMFLRADSCDYTTTTNYNIYFLV